MNKPDPEFSKRERSALAHHRMELWFGVFRTAIKAIAWVAGIYFAQFLVAPFAGKDTLLALNVAILGDIKFAATIGLAGAAGVWAVVERGLRHRKVEYLQGRIKELEKQRDPGRTSSKLTTKGKTNPEDKR